MTADEIPHYISDSALIETIDRALAEDVGNGDVTTEATVAANTRAEAVFLAKADGILAGCYVAEKILERVDPDLQTEWTRRDGQTITRGAAFGIVRGRARSILTAERLVVNVLQRMSGIATNTRRYVDAIGGHPARILDTRKTAPGLRVLDKWAVRLGGGENHRIGLFDMILIKDNHIASAGGIDAAIAAANRFRQGNELKIEVETRTLAEVQSVVDGLQARHVDMILLDNMVTLDPAGTIDVSMLRDAVGLLDGRITTEASGNVTLDTVHAIAATGVDYISCGALTHSVTALDISLQMRLMA